MGDCKKFEKGSPKETKIQLDNPRIDRVRKFIRKLLKLNQRERYDFMKTISNSELEIIEEISHNILKGNIPLNYRIYNILKRLKKQLYLLTSSKNSKKIKKKLLLSLKGLTILNTILPIALNFLA